MTKYREEPCLYTKLRLDYKYGLKSGIYTKQEIDEAKRSASFEREHNLRFLGGIGNSFRPDDVLRATSYEYDPDEWHDGWESSCGIDPAFGAGNSRFAVTITSLVDSKIRVLFSRV